MVLTIETLNKHQIALLAHMRKASAVRNRQNTPGKSVGYTLGIHKLLQWMEVQGLVFCYRSQDWNELEIANWETTEAGEALLQSIVEKAWDETHAAETVASSAVVETHAFSFPTREQREQSRIEERAEREAQRQAERDQRHLEMTEGWIVKNIIAPVLRAEWERKQPSWKSTHTPGEFARMPRQDRNHD